MHLFIVIVWINDLCRKSKRSGYMPSFLNFDYPFLNMDNNKKNSRKSNEAADSKYHQMSIFELMNAALDAVNCKLKMYKKWKIFMYKYPCYASAS